MKLKLLLAAIAVIIALLFLTRRKQPPRNLGTVTSPASELAGARAAVTATEMDDLNRAARERRQGALCARWWNV